MDPEKKFTDSGIEIKKLYCRDGQQFVHPELPGEFPFTRGIHADMYRKRMWTMSQLLNFGTAEETNSYYHYLLEQGERALHVTFDRSTQLGYDSDHAGLEEEVGNAGVVIDSLNDMETLFKGIKLEDVFTTLNINATGFIILAFYVALAKQQGADLKRITGTLQNDILNEYATKGAFIYPLRPSVRICTDVMEWCGLEMPGWNVLSISGYPMREAGITAVQEVAFTLGNGKAYVQAAIERGLDINTFGKRLSFYFAAHNNLFEEVAKFRAARRLWAKIMKELGASDDEAMMLRFHTQTSRSALMADQPVKNISRTTIQALSAVLGGTQSLYANGEDKTLESHSVDAAKTALGIQQVLAYENGIADTVDPLAGSYFVEALTNEMELKVARLLAETDAMGGNIIAIEQGYIQEEISKSAFRHKFQADKDEKIIVANNFTPESTGRRPQVEKLESFRRNRNPARCDSILQGLNDRAASDENIMPSVIEAVENKCTLGEIADTLREVFGEAK